MARRAKAKSMAEIAEEVHRQKALNPSSVMPAADSDGSWIEVYGRRFTVFDDELLPEEARDLAEASRLVVWDSCGCGGGCGYEIWQGPDVSALLKAGVPKLTNGWALQIQDNQGQSGVLCEQAVRWGPLR